MYALGEMTVLGEYVRRLRKSRGWTQEYLAERANVDQTFVSQVETGRVQRPSFEYLRRLADADPTVLRQLLTSAVEHHHARLADLRRAERAAPKP